MIEGIDHLVLTVEDIERTCGFYAGALGGEVRRSTEGRVSVFFGPQKLNLHPADGRIDPRASRPTPGSADLCFLTRRPPEEVLAHLERHGVDVVAGPVARNVAAGAALSIYVRDPDGNLVEIASPLGR